MPRPELPESRRRVRRSRLLVGWTRFVLRHPALVAVVSALVLATAGYGLLSRFRLDPSTEALLVPDSQVAVNLEKMRDLFGQDARFILLVGGDVFTPDYLKSLRNLHDALSALDLDLETLGLRRGAEKPPAAPVMDDDWGEDDASWGNESGGSIVEQVESLYNAREVRWVGDGLRIHGLLEDDWPRADQLPALRRRVMANPSLVGRLVATDAQHSVVVLRTDFMGNRDLRQVAAAIRDIAADHERPGFSVQVAGAPALRASFGVLVQRNAGRLFGLALAVMLGVLTVLFRHPLGVLGPLLVVVQTAVCTFGGMAWLNMPLTLTGNILPAFLICVGIGDSIHVQTVYAQLRKEGLGTDDAIVEAVARSGVPIAYTTATTCVGLASFTTARLAAIHDLGLVGALGVALALLWTLVTLPLFLRFDRRGRVGGGRNTLASVRWPDRLLARCAGLDLDPRRRAQRGFWILATTGALCLVMLSGALRLRTSHDGLRYMPQDHPTRVAFEQLDQHMGSGSTLGVLIEADGELGVRDPGVVAGMQKLERHGLAFRHPATGEASVTSASSLLNVLRETWRATHEDNPALHTIPPTGAGIVDMVTLFENSAPDRARRMLTVDRTHTMMTFRVAWMDAASYPPLVAHFQQGIDRFMKGGAKAVLTGSVLATRAVVFELVTDLVRSFAVALVIITLLMIAVFRDVRLGLVAMIPNLVPVLGILGFMGFRGMPLDISNLLIASIAIGIIVDDTIHLLHPFKQHHDQHGDVEAALTHAFSHCGRAVLSTSAVLSLGFAVFFTANMSNLVAFGALVVATVLFALLSDLVLAPAVLRLCYGGLPVRSDDSPPTGAAALPPRPEPSEVGKL